MLYVARVLGGFAGGGIIPLAIASVGDHVPFDRRQVALSQIMTASMAALLTSTIGTGFLATLIGWRGVFAASAAATGLVFVVALFALPGEPKSGEGGRGAAVGPIEGYRRVLANRRAYVCFAAVICEGVLVIGLLPFIATLLTARGAGGIFEAGLVLAGMAVGGLLYTQVLARMIGRMGGVANLIRLGSLFTAIGFFGIAVQGTWTFELAAFVLLGIGFYSIHNSLQTQATELAPQNRGAAVALFAFFYFVGQSIGPLFYAMVFAIAEPAYVIAGAGAVAFVLALLLAHALRRPVSAQ
jgi:predicted MFS family arabinose efflux permease